MVPDDVRVIEDTERRFEDGTVLRVRVLAVPQSEKFPDGIKYRYHYGTEDGTTLIRYDNPHGVHERHTRDGLDEDYDFPGYRASNSSSGPMSSGCVNRSSGTTTLTRHS